MRVDKSQAQPKTRARDKLIASASEMSASLARSAAPLGPSEVQVSTINTHRSGAVILSKRTRSSSRLFGTRRASFDIFLNPVNVTTLDMEVIHHASFNREMEQKNVFLVTYSRWTRSNVSAKEPKRKQGCRAIGI